MSQQTLDPTSAPPPVGRRERKKYETWLALHDAAVDLAVENGFDHVTVDAICERADVSARTFFNYFRCKEDAVLGGTHGLADVAERLRQRPAEESPLEAVRAVYGEKMRELGRVHTERIRVRQRLLCTNEALRVRDHARIAEFESGLAAVVAERVGLDADTDAYPRLVAAVAMSVLRTAFRVWDDDDPEVLADLVDEYFTAAIEGLPAPASR